MYVLNFEGGSWGLKMSKIRNLFLRGYDIVKGERRE